VPLVTGLPVRSGVRYERSAVAAGVVTGQQRAIMLASGRILRGQREIQGYVNEVLAMPWPRWRVGAQWPVVVRVTDGVRFAEYRSGVVTLPGVVPEPVVLHEIAHHFTTVARVGPASETEYHGPAWVAAYLDLIEHVMNAEASRVFRECFAAEGISV
jgi:putative metallohydrolase (TIGR04338 family)